MTFPFSPQLIVFLNNIYEAFPRAPRPEAVRKVRLSLLIFRASPVGTGVFWIVVGNPVFPFCFLVFWGLVKHIYIRSSPGSRSCSGPEEIA